MSRTYCFTAVVCLCLPGITQAQYFEGLNDIDYLIASEEYDLRGAKPERDPATDCQLVDPFTGPGYCFGDGPGDPPWTFDFLLNFRGEIAPDWYVAYPCWTNTSNINQAHFEIHRETVIKTEGDASMRIETIDEPDSLDSAGLEDIYVAHRFPTMAGKDYVLTFDLWVSDMRWPPADATFPSWIMYAVLPSGSLAADDIVDIENHDGNSPCFLRPDTQQVPTSNLDEQWHSYRYTFTAEGPDATFVLYIRNWWTPQGMVQPNYLDNLVVTEVPAAECGNGTIETGEDCDGGECCASDCTFAGSETTCGDDPTECSGQDTCDGAGTCQPNHLTSGAFCGSDGTECANQDTCDGAGSCTDNGFVAAGTSCGNPSVTDCDGADMCDSSGVCDDNLAVDGTSCDDSDACSTIDSCGTGLCVGGPDETDPTIDCSGINPARSTDPGVCTFTMPGTGFDPTFDDNCIGATLSNDFNGGSSLAGETFPEGTTTVIWTVTDDAGVTTMCSVDIVISDDEKPTITCPADLEVELTGTDGAAVAYDAPVVGDNCPGATFGCSPASGSQFAIGDHTVTCTATDDSSNEESCTFTVTVLDAAGVIENVIDEVIELGDAGVLNGGQTNSLLVKLERALDKIDHKKNNVSCNTLAAFIHQVTGLDEAQGLPLIDSAHNARAALGCDPRP